MKRFKFSLVLLVGFLAIRVSSLGQDGKKGSTTAFIPSPRFIPVDYDGWNCTDPMNIQSGDHHFGVGPIDPGFGFATILSIGPSSACWETPLGNGWFIQAFRGVVTDGSICTTDVPAPCDLDGVRLCNPAAAQPNAKFKTTICGDLGATNGCALCPSYRVVPHK